MSLNNIITERLLLIPFTTKMVLSLMNGEKYEFTEMNLGFGNGWPDKDALETMPKILKNLTLVEAPTGFES
ncbi:MAG: hypothetical protein V4663_01065 [Bacteroidota bacterium]